MCFEFSLCVCVCVCVSVSPSRERTRKSEPEKKPKGERRKSLTTTGRREWRERESFWCLQQFSDWDLRAGKKKGVSQQEKKDRERELEKDTG